MIPSVVSSNIQSLKSGGVQISKPNLSFFKSRFGYNFNTVRVHSNPEAASAARAINARAFTTGRDIFFGSDQYHPETGEGKRLLAHELTHIIQQNGQTARIQREQIPQYTRPPSRGARRAPGGGYQLSVGQFQVIVLPDGTSSDQSLTGDAITGFSLQNEGVEYELGEGGRVRLISPPGQATVTLQTNYGPNAFRTIRAGYGRGTTPDDIRAGNTTLGFHEHCHYDDLLGYLGSHQLPTFSGRDGDTRFVFLAAISLYRHDLNDYLDRARLFTIQQTDCVGSPTIDQLRGTNYCSGGGSAIP